MFQSAQAKCAFEPLISRFSFLCVESLITHHCHCPCHCFFTEIVTQMSLFKGAVPRAGQTFHQGLILAFILFLNYLLARLSPLQLCAGIISANVFIVGCSARSLFLLFVPSGRVWFLLWECLCLWQQQGRGAGAAHGCQLLSRICSGMCQMCQASAFCGFLSPFSSVLLQRRQDSLRAVCAAPAAWCSLGDVVVTAQPRLSLSGVR